MVVVNQKFDNKKGILMVERMLEKHKDQLPEGKTINDYGGGYVECLKTKAKVVLYFGFTSSNNRVQIKFDIAKEDVVRWQNAIAQKLWNKPSYDEDVEMFEEDEPALALTATEKLPSEVSSVQGNESNETIRDDKFDGEGFAWK